MQRIFFGLNARVLTVLMLGSSVLLIITGYFVLTERANAEASAIEQLRANAERIASEQDDIITDAQQLITFLRLNRNWHEYAGSPDCKRDFEVLAKRDLRFADIALADSNGEMICNSTPSVGPINIADRAYFQNAIATSQFVTSDAIISRSVNRFGLPVAKAIRNKTGQVQYVLIVLLDLAWINSDLSSSHLPKSARVGLIAHHGLVLARYPDAERLIGTNVADTSLFKNIVSHDVTASFQRLGFDQVTRIFAATRFANTTSGPIFLYLSVPKESITGPIDRKYAWVFIVSLATIVLTFLGVWALLNRLIMHPIAVISATARRIAHGDSNSRTGLRYANHEMGQLSRTFDEMAVALMSKNEILRLNRALEAISQCDEVLIHATDEAKLLQDICGVIVKVAGYHLAWVGFAEHDANKTVRPVAHAGYEEGYIEQASISWADNEQGSGPAGKAIRTREPCVILNAHIDPTYAPWRANALNIGYRSICCFPLVSAGTVLGALCIYSIETEGFHADELKLLRELADDLAFGIVTLRGRAAEAEATRRLAKTTQATVSAMNAIVDMRDPYTAGHQNRVAELSSAIAREIGLSKLEIEGIALAASIHDLGKIQIPAEILSKPSKLSNLEYSIIKEHAQSGYNILKNLDFPWPIAEMVYQHHERIDGSGYPRGLKDAEIAIGAKIIGVADTVEAMASDRPYRPGFGIDKAMEEITKNRGKFYDAAVVDACVKLFRENRFALPH